MGSRGSYAKGIAKREEILQAALGMISRDGYSRTTIPNLSAAVGLSPTGLIHHFGTKDQLFSAIIERRNAVDEEFFRAQFEKGGGIPNFGGVLAAKIRQGAPKDGFVELDVRYTAEAADSSHPSHDFFKQHFALVQQMTAEGLQRSQSENTVSKDVDPEKSAQLTFAVIEGLKLMSMFDPGIDRAGLIEHFWEVILQRARPTSVGAPAGRPPECHDMEISASMRPPATESGYSPEVQGGDT